MSLELTPGFLIVGVALLIALVAMGWALFDLAGRMWGAIRSARRPLRARATYEALPSKRDRHREAHLEWERAFEDAMPPIDMNTPEGLAEARRLERMEKTRIIGAQARGEDVMVDTFGEAPYRAARGYFSADGDYGDAANLVIIDTSGWTEDHWDFMRDELSDAQRYEVALGISRGDGSLDQQDCPAIEYREDGNLEVVHEIECGFTGIVYREFANRADGEEGGYTWTCPFCDSLNVYEGDESTDSGE